MTAWYAFQLVFDIVVCFLVIGYVVRDARNRKNAPNLHELKTLVEDFKAAVERSEKAALNLDAKLKNVMPPKPSAPREETHEAHPKGNGRPHHAASFRTPGVDEQKKKVGVLYKQGLSKGEISRQLGIPLPEVELIIALLPSDD